MGVTAGAEDKEEWRMEDGVTAGAVENGECLMSLRKRNGEFSISI